MDKSLSRRRRRRCWRVGCLVRCWRAPGRTKSTTGPGSAGTDDGLRVAGFQVCLVFLVCGGENSRDLSLASCLQSFVMEKRSRDKRDGMGKQKRERKKVPLTSSIEKVTADNRERQRDDQTRVPPRQGPVRRVLLELFERHLRGPRRTWRSRPRLRFPRQRRVRRECWARAAAACTR